MSTSHSFENIRGVWPNPRASPPPLSALCCMPVKHDLKYYFFDVAGTTFAVWWPRFKVTYIGLSRPLLLERKIPLDKKTIQVTQTLTLKLTIRKQTYHSMLLKCVSCCYCYCSVTNGIFRSEREATLSRSALRAKETCKKYLAMHC